MKDNIKKVIYKYKNALYKDKFRQELKKDTFCNDTIVYILYGQKKSGYYITKDHSA